LQLIKVQSNNEADEVVGSAAQKRSGAENVEEPKKKRSKADKQKQAAETEREEVDNDERKKGTNGPKSRHEDQAEGHIGVHVEEVTLQPKTQAKPQKLAKVRLLAAARGLMITTGGHYYVCVFGMAQSILLEDCSTAHDKDHWALRV
jgi:hypothetical protein